MARYYPHLDLRQLDTPGGRLTWRLLGVILPRLPIDSATRTHMRDTLPVPPVDENAAPDFTGQPWSLTNYQLQALHDTLRAVNWDSEKAGPYKPLPVPQMKTAGDAVNSSVDAEKMAILERLRKSRGAFESAGVTETRSYRND